MNRILAIDYGLQRVGLAVTDPLQLIANGLDTVSTSEVVDYLKSYLEAEAVETFVVGYPLHEDGSPAQIAPQIDEFIEQLRQLFPAIDIVLEDERYTSQEAKKIILASGVPKKKRRDKGLVDKVSAVLILQAYMERQASNNL